MRLYEFTVPRLYLCTNTAQQVDSVVSLDEPIYWFGEKLEAAIEAQRPEGGSLPRSQSIILALSPGGTEFAYVVEPVGTLERQNAGWLQKLREVDLSLPGVLAHYAIGYWSGQECPEARGEPWEYRASAVKILKRVGRSAQDV